LAALLMMQVSLLLFELNRAGDTYIGSKAATHEHQRPLSEAHTGLVTPPPAAMQPPH
jgi:hypothetical protein